MHEIVNRTFNAMRAVSTRLKAVRPPTPQPAEGVSPIRMRLVDVLATDENFDEAGYLAANADIAAAVLTGNLTSGRRHFKALGRVEQRCIRILIPVDLIENNSTHISITAAHQNAIDIFAGNWVSSFPDSAGVAAGVNKLFEDTRIDWMIEQFGGIKEFDVLELGAFEGAHAAMMLARGARSIIGIEGNRSSFIKCLITKNILNLDNAKFLLGDFVSWMRQTTAHFDLVVASGVLYHMADPLELLELISQKADRLFLITHYFDQSLVDARDSRLPPFCGARAVPWRGKKITLHQRNYGHDAFSDQFFGGPTPYVMWMERPDIISVLEELGYKTIRVEEDAAHKFGPSLWVSAIRD